MKRLQDRLIRAKAGLAKSVGVRSLLLMLLIAGAMLLCPSTGRAEELPRERSTRMINQLDELLAQVKPGQTTVYVDDMGFSVEKLKAYRDQLKSGSKSAFALVSLWPSGVVPYDYDSGLEASKKTKFEAALAIWENVANVNFVVRTSQTNYIRVFDGGDNMNSKVGMEGGQQTLNFADWGTTYNAVHELGHALGLVHEHTRSDRDNYVIIHYENIKAGKSGNFDLVANSTNFGPYDFDSVMHYPKDGFSKNGGLTIECKAAYSQYQNSMGQRNHLSDFDIAGMIEKYGPGPHPVRVVWNTNNSGAGSLRQAITDANGKSGTTIRFHIYTIDPNYSAAAGTYTIRPTSPLPAVTASDTVIDGRTQTTIANTNVNGPEIVLNGASAGSATGLRIQGAQCKVLSMTINGFSQYGINITGAGAAFNLVQSCYIGTSSTGLSASPNALNGVLISAGADLNTIGGASSTTRNIISGNTGSGVRINGAGTTKNVVSGNFIGPSATGNGDLGNGIRGVLIDAGAALNTIGGTIAERRNVISGNTGEGIYISGSGTDSNLVQGNFIGLNAAGTSAMANADGVTIASAAKSNTIGGAAAGTRNIIAGNTDDGIVILSAGTNDNVVANNYIGLLGNSTAIPNGGDGVRIYGGAQSNDIGGLGSDARNVISANGGNGIYISGAGTNSNVTYGNYIGTNVSGTGAVGNLGKGVLISAGAQSNNVGGALSRNVISGNASDGVEISGAGTNSNRVYSNYIGLNAIGTAAVKNGGRGVLIFDGAQSTIVGGSSQFFNLGNVISGNTSYGILISGAGTDNNTVASNYIGTDATGTIKVFNSYGVYIASGAKNNTVGGLTSGLRNVISGNTNSGVYLSLSGTTGNKVLGNYIGTDRNGTAALPNNYGVIIYVASSNFIGGSVTGSRNLISGNKYDGVYMSGGASFNTVAGNSIGTSAGRGTLPNGSGINLNGASNNVIGGSGTTAGNRIAYNHGDGVRVGSGSGNLIWTNAIFSNDGLGINLQPSGEVASTVTLNDLNDPDTGPNGLQNFPLLGGITTSGGNTTVKGGLNGVPGTYSIHLYRNFSADPSGYGEGTTFVDVKRVIIPSGSNNVGFSFSVSGEFPGQFFTATATGQSEGTSEFSPVSAAPASTTAASS